MSDGPEDKQLVCTPLPGANYGGGSKGEIGQRGSMMVGMFPI